MHGTMQLTEAATDPTESKQREVLTDACRALQLGQFPSVGVRHKVHGDVRVSGQADQCALLALGHFREIA